MWPMIILLWDLDSPFLLFQGWIAFESKCPFRFLFCLGSTPQPFIYLCVTCNKSFSLKSLRKISQRVVKLYREISRCKDVLMIV